MPRVPQPRRSLYFGGGDNAAKGSYILTLVSQDMHSRLEQLDLVPCRLWGPSSSEGLSNSLGTTMSPTTGKKRRSKQAQDGKSLFSPLESCRERGAEGTPAPA